MYWDFEFLIVIDYDLYILFLIFYYSRKVYVSLNASSEAWENVERFLSIFTFLLMFI